MGVWENYSDMRKRLMKLLDECMEAEFPWDTHSEIADHLLANGVIVPPCKIGEPIYRVCSPRGTYHKPYIRKFKLTYKTLASTIEDFGKTVFLTREEAENALRKGGAE